MTLIGSSIGSSNRMQLKEEQVRLRMEQETNNRRRSAPPEEVATTPRPLIASWKN